MEFAVANNSDGSAEVERILLQHQSDLEISEEMMKLAAANFSGGERVLRTLLHHQPEIETSKKMVTCGLKAPKAVEILLHHQPNIEISKKVIELAAAVD